MATIHYPGVPGTILYGGRPKAPPAPSGQGVNVNVQVTNNSGAALSSSPTTFGHAFTPGAWFPDADDLYAAVGGTQLPVQTDSLALHPDGSARFAVVSTDTGAMTTGQTKTVNLTLGAKRVASNPQLAAIPINVVAEATIYGVHRYIVACGTDGSAFVADETVTLRLTIGGADHDYTVTVLAGQTSGFSVATQIIAAVNAGGLFRARINGYTRIIIERVDPLVGPFTATAIYAGAAQFVPTVHSTFAAPVVWTATLQPELDTQIAQSNANSIVQHKRRLHGPVVTELRQMAKFKDASNNDHPLLSVVADTRIYADGRKFVDVAIENTRLNTSAPDAVNYKMDFKVNGSVVYTEPRFWHYARARWHKQIWIGGNPNLHVAKDVAYSMTTLTTPNYDPSHNPTGLSLDTQVANAASRKASNAYHGPLALQVLSAYMPQTGGRGDIGLLSEWARDWTTVQDTRSKSLMLMASDDAGAFDTHFRDEATGWPAASDMQPNLELGRNFPTIALPVEMPPWEPDTSHQPTTGYHPYLATGDAYHLDEMMFWGSWNLFEGNRTYRPSLNVGLLLGSQTRAFAWMTRSIMEICLALPASHPRRDFYQNQLDANVAHVNAVKGVSWANGPFNCLLLQGAYTDSWQGDFVMQVLGWMAENGVQGVSTIIDHLAEYQFGRVLHEDAGVCPAWLDIYFEDLRLPGGALVSTWEEYAVVIGKTDYGKTCGTAPRANYDYAMSCRGGAASCANAGNVLGALAYQKIKAITGLYNIPNNDFRKWAIIPRV